MAVIRASLKSDISSALQQQLSGGLHAIASGIVALQTSQRCSTMSTRGYVLWYRNYSSEFLPRHLPRQVLSNVLLIAHSCLVTHYVAWRLHSLFLQRKPPTSKSRSRFSSAAVTLLAAPPFGLHRYDCSKSSTSDFSLLFGSSGSHSGSNGASDSI